MANFLIDHAIQSISASRYQDRQYIFKAKHINKTSGSINNFELMGRFIELPTPNRYYHVYNIGRVPLKKVGLLTTYPEYMYERWKSITSSVVIQNLIVNIYKTGGIEIPKYDTHYMLTNEGDLIPATPELKGLAIMYIDTIYTRVYSNSYFNSDRSSHLTIKTVNMGGLMSSTQDILNLQSNYNTLSIREGSVIAHVNGYLVNSINLLTTHVGDYAEITYDGSVKQVIDIPVSDLRSFTSTLDNKLKYLVHYQDPTPNETTTDIIDYHDDVDIYLTYDTGNSLKGLYYNRNVEDSYRMVTHRDYSIPVDYLVFIATSLSSTGFGGNASMNDMSIRLVVRHSGLDRPLEYDNNRLFELYKMDDSDIMTTMLGTTGSLSRWRAPYLEASSYTKLMRSFSQDINENMVVDTYGYNGLSKLLGDTPSKVHVEFGAKVADLPYGLVDNSTVYEYDSDGLLIGTSYHSSGGKYVTTTIGVANVECLYGYGSDTPNVTFGTDGLSVPVNSGYRVYRSFLVNGNSDENWEDITGSDKYSVVNDTIVWGSTEFNQFLMVRRDDSYLDYDLDIVSVEGNLFFTLAEFEDRGNGLINYTLPVPLAQLDIWMNGRSLIEDIDYKVVFPIVYIINKKYVIQTTETATQSLHIRMYWFTDNTLARDVNEDIGFIEHGVLSNNNVFDLRDDRVMHMTVDGYLKTRDDVIFSEQHTGVSIINASNGLPYQIKDIIVPLNKTISVDTYVLRNESIAIDKEVSDYLSTKIPQPVRNGLSSILAKYNVVSPFFATIIAHLENDIITIDMINAVNNNTDLLSLLNPYE